MPGERGRLARDPLHHAAIAAQRVGAPVDHRIVRAIEIGAEPALGDCEADAHRDALAEWPGGRLDARGQMVFRMAWAGAVELPETS